MRYLALTKQDHDEMLKEIGTSVPGISSIDDLYDAVPKDVLLKKPISGLPNHQGEIEVENFLSNLSKKNRPANSAPFFLGAGCYNHHIPAAVDHIIQRSEFLTSYTPYQPEIAQGTLATIFQFQSTIALLTGMEVANASMYDGATALAEAVLMTLRIKKDRKNIYLHNALNADYKNVLSTYTDLAGAEINQNLDEKTACVIVSYPDFHGNIADLAEVRKKCDAAGALMIVVVTEILSLGLLEAPKMADIVVGEASSVGVGMNFGGPHLGFFACKKSDVRQMPGRICGLTTDEDGKPGYVLTLNAREQHIRREKATSNICSNQGLCATAFTIHSMLLGEIGFKHLALINHKKACDLAAKLAKVGGVKILNKNFFNEFTIELSKDSFAVNKKLLEKNIIGGLALEGNKLLVAATELTSENDIEIFAKELAEILK
ncbi:MAG: Glycine dehydrogenase [decarboxylating] (glycine cleavage system protein) [Rickettsiaceae bacterium]|jgi:glycine dehydrogenase subunit 1|nr:Glycine dehydrogenase [decarboxylating] (glycine cleavage system protein) [Rickettsiaceae bacterium]